MKYLGYFVCGCDLHFDMHFIAIITQLGISSTASENVFYTHIHTPHVHVGSMYVLHIAYIHTYKHTNIHTHIHVHYVHTDTHTYTMYIHTLYNVHTHIHVHSLHTYIHTYIHTCTHIHTYMYVHNLSDS